MIVYRIVRREFDKDPLSGAGGIFSHGRWHFKGVPLVYTSSTLSLAALEIFVHLAPDGDSIDHTSVAIEIPHDISVAALDDAHLPHNWRNYPSPVENKQIGMKWIHARRSAVLSVPSTLIPAERNYLLNPLHPDSIKFKVIYTSKFSFDPRMWKVSAKK